MKGALAKKPLIRAVVESDPLRLVGFGSVFIISLCRERIECLCLLCIATSGGLFRSSSPVL